MAKRNVEIGYVAKSKAGKQYLVIEGEYNPATKSRQPVKLGGSEKTTLFIKNLDEELESASERMSPESYAKFQKRVENTPDWKRKILEMVIETE